MKHYLPSLEALKVFEAAGRHLSFSRAADELCLTKGAVSYQLRKLEESMDIALFRRSTRQVYLTDSGQELLQTTQRLFADLSRTIDQIKPGDTRHDVLVAVTTYVALRWLSPRIASFIEQHPGVSILLQHSVNSQDFYSQNVDFAIHWREMDEKNNRSSLLEMPMPLFPVCSPGLLERNGIGADASGLENIALATLPLGNLPLLCEDRSLDLWQAWYGQQEISLGNPRRVIADANVRTQAAIDGQGWTMADGLMQAELSSGVLVAPFASRLEGYGYAIQSSPGRFINRDAGKFRDWLIAHA